MEKGLKKILVVDDSITMRKLMEAQLQKNRFVTSLATNGIEALEMVEQSSYDMLLLDLHMQPISGIEVLQKIRDKYSKTLLPVIMVTTSDSLDDFTTALEIGANDYVIKPIDFDILLARMNTHLSIADLMRDKKNLIRVLAHDINSPLSIIVGNCGIMARQKSLGEDVRKRVDNVMKASANIQEIVESVRTLESIESDKFEVDIRSSQIEEIVESLREHYGEAAVNKNVELKFSIDETAEGATVLADKSCLVNQVFGNLISNAIKFSKAGQCIQIETWADQENLYSQVIDQGVGMPEELASRIFNEAGHTSRSGTAGEKGTGFGMPITKAFVEKFGGSISVKSKSIDSFPEDHGTVFKVKLRLENRLSA